MAACPPGAPIAVLIHGYRFDPGTPDHDPHRLLYAQAPARQSAKLASWTDGLGFGAGPETGLAIGFGWPARAAHLPSLVRLGHTGFAEVYARAGAAGAALAALIAQIAHLAPNRPIDILAHSLGARVALSALPRLGPAAAGAVGRLILLGGAEYAGTARAALAKLAQVGAQGPSLAQGQALAKGQVRAQGQALAKGQAQEPAGAPQKQAGEEIRAAPEIYSITARQNDVYDALFETFAPRGDALCDQVLSRGVDAPDWFSLQLDAPHVMGWAAARGIALEPAARAVCHWSFYTRPGALALYGRILRDRAAWSVAALRRAPALAAHEPRWTRLSGLPRAAVSVPRPRLRRARGL
ncbi:MAG: alpha/beta hydrolase [Pseudomonadota bacterium]